MSNTQPGPIAYNVSKKKEKRTPGRRRHPKQSKMTLVGGKKSAK
jgi:hypothetical protein